MCVTVVSPARIGVERSPTSPGRCAPADYASYPLSMRISSLLSARGAIRGLVVGGLVVASSGVASAHTLIITPARRDADKPADMSDNHKGTDVKCGDVAKTAIPTQYQPGQAITVQWDETIDHIGCFQWALSTDNDATFTVLPTAMGNASSGQKNIDDPNNAGVSRATPRHLSTTLTLPMTPCANCTLQLRQLMLSALCTDTVEAPAMSTYVSCADIRIGTFADAGPSQLPDASAPTSSSSNSSSGSSGDVDGDTPDAGKKASSRAYTTDDDVGQCTLGAGPSAGLFGLGTLLLGLRRRRRS